MWLRRNVHACSRMCVITCACFFPCMSERIRVACAHTYCTRSKRKKERKREREKMYERQRKCTYVCVVYDRRDTEYLCIGVYPCISFTYMYIFLPFFYIYVRPYIYTREFHKNI